MAARKEIDLELVEGLRLQGVTVDEVCKRLKVSRSTLLTRIREHGGHSIPHVVKLEEESPWDLERWAKAMPWLEQK